MNVQKVIMREVCDALSPVLAKCGNAERRDVNPAGTRDGGGRGAKLPPHTAA
jgi:hypothetical protein